MSTNDELPFRITFGIFWLVNMLVRIYFQSKVIGVEVAAATHERRSKLFFRILALMYLIMLLYVFSSWFDFAQFPISAMARWLCGVGFLLAFLLLFSWTHATLGKNWSGLLEIHKDHVLIINGPYRFIRHPMYAAFILSGFGYLFLSANWLIGGLYLTIVTAMYIDRVVPEEQMMIDHFGEQYQVYMQTTGRLLPRFHKW